MRRLAKVIGTLGLAGVLVGTAVPAAVAGDDDVIRRGSCSGRSDWKLKVGTDDGRLDGEFEVDSNVNGQRWRVRIFRDDVLIVSTTKTTQPPSGSFEVDFRAPNPPGSDLIRARARSLATGEVCRARLLF